MIEVFITSFTTQQQIAAFDKALLYLRCKANWDDPRLKGLCGYGERVVDGETQYYLHLNCKFFIDPTVTVDVWLTEFPWLTPFFDEGSKADFAAKVVKAQQPNPETLQIEEVEIKTLFPDAWLWRVQEIEGATQEEFV